MARRPRPWDGVRPRGLRGEAGLAGVRCAPGPAATATPWLCQKVKGPAGGRLERPAREERARKARGGAAEGAGGAATSACPHPQPPASSRGRGRSYGANAGSQEQPRFRSLPDGRGCALAVGRTGCHRAASGTPSKFPSGHAGAKAEGSRGDGEAQPGCRRCQASTHYTSSTGGEAEERWG